MPVNIVVKYFPRGVMGIVFPARLNEDAANACRHRFRRAAFFSVLSAIATAGITSHAADAPPPTTSSALEREFDAGISPDEMGVWLQRMSAEPNHVGSPHDKANAEWELAQFQKFGWNAHIETFEVLYPTPISESVELLDTTPYQVTLQEPPIPGDSSATAHDRALPAYLAYQGDGDVTAPLVYVNYGMQEDYKTLLRMGVSVAGKIVIARYGAGWRGLKPKLAQEHGAVGCLIYSDPTDDGYAVESPYPQGPARPPQGIQRGSVIDFTVFGGDPLTPGVGATADAKRLKISESPVILRIPALPIGYGDAQVLLKSMSGRVVPKEWRGALPITYRVGPSTARVHLLVKSDWSLIEVRIEKNRFRFASPVKSHDDIHFVGFRSAHKDILVGKSCCFEAGCKRGGGLRGTYCVSAIDADELRKNTVRHLLVMLGRSRHHERGGVNN